MKTTHTIIHIAIDVPDAKTLPLLVELDNPDDPRVSYHVAKFARYLQKEGQASYEKISKMVKVIGKLRDYYLLVRGGETVASHELRELIEDFLAAYDKGTVLSWRAASLSEYSFGRNAIREYMAWLKDLGGLDGMPKEEVILINNYREAFQYSQHLSKSLLFHTKKQLRKENRRGRKRSVIGLRQYKPFPHNSVCDLIDETANVRDKIAFMLMAFGGRRISEIINLFVRDFKPAKGELSVTLAHPSYSHYTWRTKLNKEISGTRAEYLKSMFKMLPRTEMGKHPLAAGWKGVKFDDEATLTSDFYFIRDVGPYLLYLHDKYIRESRGRFKHHPYYFINEHGEPLTIKALKKQFYAACKRVGKKNNISLTGYGPHSLRHYYGFYCADVLKIDLLMIQKWMGHQQPSSTAIYAHISPATAHAALASAEKRAKLEGRIQSTVEERLEIQKEFQSATVEAIPAHWRDTTLIHGTLDPSKLRRRLR
jgi:integrase